jgi:hypothetical protein
MGGRPATYLPVAGADEVDFPLEASLRVGKDHESIMKVGEPYVHLIGMAMEISLASEPTTNALQMLNTSQWIVDGA